MAAANMGNDDGGDGWGGGGAADDDWGVGTGGGDNGGDNGGSGTSMATQQVLIKNLLGARACSVVSAFWHGGSSVKAHLDNTDRAGGLSRVLRLVPPTDKAQRATKKIHRDLESAKEAVFATAETEVDDMLEAIDKDLCACSYLY